MSYILDALRKSDQQRQNGAAPTLYSAASLPPASPTRGKPAPLIYGLIALVLLALGMTIGILRPWQTEPAPLLLTAPQPEPIVAPPAIATPTLRTAPEISTPAPLPTPAESAPVAQPPQAKPRQEQPQITPPKALPTITITVHAYSPDPSERLAGINGKMLREGQKIAPGLKLERITAEGVVLNYQGQRFRREVQ